MRRVIRNAALAVVMVLTLGACDFSAYSLPLPGGADLGDHSYAVDIEFRDVLDLVPQSAVKVDEVTVGKVEDVRLDGYTAVVTVRLNGDVKLPENSLARIRQTSLLGEKFVDLAPPSSDPSTGQLRDGDTIPLSRSGRNPEVEEVLGALSLLLNGGGVAQLKTIAQELNNTLEGRETEVRDVLSQLDTFMRQVDQNKQDIVSAIRSVNKLAIAVKKQKTTIVNTLDQLPEALQVLDEQRAGLVKMLKGIERLSPVAVRVIKASKRDTLANLRALDPILTKVADAGDSIPKALQVFLTYPFVDAAVGTSPTEARNLHQGDYTNLSAQLDLDLESLPGLPGVPDVCDQAPQLPVCPTLPSLPSVSLPSLPTVTNPAPTDITTILDPVVKCLKNPSLPRCSKPITRFCKKHPLGARCKQLIRTFCKNFPDSKRCTDLVSLLCRLLPVGCDDGGGTPPSTGGGGGGPTGSVCTLAPILCRPPPDYDRDRFSRRGLDKDLALLLLQGVSGR